MGVVYRAHDEVLQRTVAIKVVDREPGTGDERQRIIEEARAASGLSHPNICTVYETGSVAGRAFIAMEFVDGRPLSESIPAGGLPVSALVRYGIQVADALAHAHRRGVVHRDLKSANVVIGPDGRAKVLDFGLARRVAADITTTVTRSSDAAGSAPLAGTLAYMAPELLLGATADARSDIWSLGVMLYEMATGELPFRGRNEFDITASILRAPPQPFPSSVPPIVRGIVQRCLAKEPSQRYEHAGELRAALEAVQSDAVGFLPAEPSRLRGRRGPIVAAAIAGALAAGAFWIARPASSPWERIAGGGRFTLALASDRPLFEPAISRDGKMLCYALEDASGVTDLYVRRVAGGSVVRITRDDAREGWPRFSPDGELIAFSRREPGAQAPHIRIVPALGGDPVSTIPDAAVPAWSPDGRRLAYLRAAPDGSASLVVSRPDGTETRTVLAAGGTYPFLRHPAWSPDGRHIAIVRGTGGVAGEIWLVPAGGGEPRRVIVDPPEVFSESPAFTRDGLGIVHSSNRGGATNIWFHPLRGGEPVRLTAGAGPDAIPTVADDGTISYINTRWRNSLEVHRLGDGAVRTLATHAPYLWGPVFSPDGAEVAFSRSEVDGTWHIWSVPAAGGTPTRLTDTPDGEVYPRYTRDGRSLFFHTWSSTRRVGVVPRGGGAVKLISFGERLAGFPDPAPDGRRIALTLGGEDAERVYIAPAGGGEPRLLSASAGTVPRWSPDGALIAFAANRGYRGGIFVIGADGRGERRLTEVGGWPAWWPDGRQIGYLVAGPLGNQELHVVPLDGGPSRHLAAIRYRGWNHPFDVSPDGSSIVTTNGVHQSDEIWFLEPTPHR